MKIQVSKGFIRDVDGIWHRMDCACRFYIKIESRKGKRYGQVLGEFVQGYQKYLIEFTRVLGGKKKAQKILDEAFLECSNP